MSMLLHVQSSTRGARSFSLRVANAFIQSYMEAHPGDKVTNLDVTSAPIPEFGPLAAAGKYRLMQGERPTPEEEKSWRQIESAISEFKKADKLLISSPMWNFGIPYRLKQFFDVIVQPGYTFSFDPREGYSGLVTGRPAMLILARGGAYPPGTEYASMDFQRPYLEHILRFIGFQDIRCIVVEPTLHDGPEAAEKNLLKCIAQAREEALKF